MPVLELAGEERPRRRERLELPPVVAEADDDGARVRGPRAPRAARARPCSRSASRSRRRSARSVAKKRANRSALPSSGWRSSALPGFGGSAPRLLEQRGQRLLAGLGPELVHVDARRHDLDAVDVPGDLLEHVADVLGAGVDDLGPGERLGAPARELGTAAHRVLELRAVRLDRGSAARSQRRRAPRAGRGSRSTRSAGASSRSAAAFAATYASRSAAVKSTSSRASSPSYRSRTKTGSRPPGQVGHDDPRPAEVVALRMPLLADDRHVVPGEAPLARERARVDVRARPAEQIPVPEQDPHGRTLPRSGGSRARRAARRPGSTCGRSRRTASRAAPRSS